MLVFNIGADVNLPLTAAPVHVSRVRDLSQGGTCSRRAIGMYGCRV